MPVSTFIDAESGATVESRVWAGSGTRVGSDGRIEVGTFENGVLSTAKGARYKNVAELYSSALAQIRAKEFKTAINSHELALKIYDPSNHYAIVSVYSCLGTCYRDLGNVEEAISHCEKGLLACEQLDLTDSKNISFQQAISKKRDALTQH